MTALFVILGLIATLLGVAAICSVKLGSMIDESTFEEKDFIPWDKE